jgi:Protein of unknown function (DUF3108)
MDGPFRDPEIPDGETTAYRGLVSGRPAGEGRMVVEASPGAYVQRLRSDIGGMVHGELEMRFARVNGTLVAEHYRLQTGNGDRPYSVEEGWFRDVRVLHWGGESVTYPRGITPLLGCAVALRGLEFARGERHRFPLWLANSAFWEIEIHVERRERLTVAAGTFEAWRASARPRFEAIAGPLDRLVGALLPPFRLWFDAAAPHRFLRFSFPTGPFPWNPRGVIEAAALD